MSTNIVWVDENDAVLGETTREKAHAEGLLHRIAVTYLVNAEGEILVNERADDGRFDHSSAGHVDAGESYVETARRELKEELGIDGIDIKEIGGSISQDLINDPGQPFMNARHIFKVFLGVLLRPDLIRIDPDEVKSVFWADPNKVMEDMRSNPSRYAGGFKSSLPVYLDSQG
ncbi:MAG: NUDIX domain-containing protein [bacterium]